MKFCGYDFNDEELLLEALTTPSYRMSNPAAVDNQRLEFLGDAVLGMLAAERLYREFPTRDEGELTVQRTHLVSTASLCAAAERINLAAQLRRNRGAEELPRNSKTFADAIEAIIGAAYLDGGLEGARAVFNALALEVNAKGASWSENSKGELQVRAQAMKPPRHPEYETISITGKAHLPRFTMRVSVEGMGEAEASAGSRREAESKAAAKLLSMI